MATNVNCSCDICNHGISHDYVPNHYYCTKNLFFNDKAPVSNCDEGTIDPFRYKLKFGKSYVEE